MSVVSYLWDLQNLEERKAELEKQMKNIPEFKELKQLKQEIEGGREEVRKLKDELAANKMHLREVNDTIAVFREKIKKASAELYSGEIKNAKELEAAEKNIRAIKDKVDQEEDRALKLMETLEDYEQRIDKIIRDLDGKKNTFRKLNRFYNDKKVELLGILNELEATREALIKKIDPAFLERYRQLCEKQADRKGIALLKGGICSGCHVTVSFDVRRQARAGSDELVCDNCGRLLVCE